MGLWNRTVAALALVLAAGCHMTTENTAPVVRHPIHGVIVSLDAGSKTATIKHGDIPGFMDAMTMEFPVKDGREYAGLRNGETIDATVFVQDTDYWVGEIKEGK